MRLERWRKPNRAALLGWAFPAALLMGVGMLGAVRGGQESGDVAWLEDYPAALQIARRTHRPLLLQFYRPGCVWCGKMDAETFADAHVSNLSRRFVSVRVNGEADTAMAAQYGVLELPATVFADPQGKVMGRLAGYTPPARFAQAEQRVLEAGR